jgi:drug/metabolite transporter (DMT)-like permease
MIFVVGVAAALSLGLGYVLQQRVASTAPLSEVLHFRLLYDLMHRPLWWAGIGAMVVGQLLSGYALQLATVALVEPLLSTSLLFALVFSSVLSRIRIRWTEIAGSVLLSAALGVFIYVGNPHSSDGPRPDNLIIMVAILAVLAAVAILVAVAKHKPLISESILLAAGAGVLYGLQDASTRGALVTFDHHGLVHAFLSPWPYIVVGAAVIGILLAQSAFKTARLDYSLPPIAATEPVVGILLGVTLLGDELSVTPLALALQSLCLVAMIAGVMLIARSANLAACGRVVESISPVPASRADSV